MNKKKYGLISAGVLLFIISCALVVLHNNNQVTPTTLSQLKAKSSANPTTCLTEKDDPNIKADPQEQTYIANAAIANIIDIPAGTHVDVYLKTYDGSTATGTSIYAGKYGSYNFTAEKTGTETNNSYQGNWKIDAFAACKL